MLWSLPLVAAVVSTTTASPLIYPNLFPTIELWQTLPQLMTSRQEHSVGVLNNRIYVAGGILSNISYSPEHLPTDDFSLFSNLYTTDSVQYYDLATRSWHAAASLPFGVNHGNMATVNGKLYLLGGLSGFNLSSWNALPNAWVYDPNRDRWSAVAPMPTGVARGACARAVYGDEVYLAGGMTELELVGDQTQASVNTVSAYNTRTNTWRTDLPPLPGARDHVAGGIVGHTFYVTGGRDHSQWNWKNDTWALDLTNIAAGWVAKAPMLTARGGLAYATVGNKLYTFGGEANPRNNRTDVFDNVEMYDPMTDSWRELRKMKVPRHGMGAVAIGNRIYVPGGGVKISAAPSSDFDVYQLF